VGTDKISTIESRFNNFFAKKLKLFKTKTGSGFDKAVFYLKALCTTEKMHRNIEKMTDDAFREAKQELGMTDYQIRGWLAWHHHIALVMMAMAFTFPV
jgi:SRSO17 transposase